MNLGVSVNNWKEEKWGDMNKWYLAPLQFGIAGNPERTERSKIPA